MAVDVLYLAGSAGDRICNCQIAERLGSIIHDRELKPSATRRKLNRGGHVIRIIPNRVPLDEMNTWAVRDYAGVRRLEA